jgi:hypothetical protein
MNTALLILEDHIALRELIEPGQPAALGEDCDPGLSWPEPGGTQIIMSRTLAPGQDATAQAVTRLDRRKSRPCAASCAARASPDRPPPMIRVSISIAQDTSSAKDNRFVFVGQTDVMRDTRGLVAVLLQTLPGNLPSP